MTILYLHGFCANLNGRKASCLRSCFGESAVIEPPDPGFPYCKSLTVPILRRLGDRFKKDPKALLGLFGPNRISELNRLAPELLSFFARSVEMAQELYCQVRPDVIVGSSLGGSVAMAIDSTDTPMVLIGPVWNRDIRSANLAGNMPDAGAFTKLLLSVAITASRKTIAGFAGFEVPRSIKPQTVILHSAHDEVFDLANSHMLVRNSPIAFDDPSRARIGRVIDRLATAGYANQRSDGDGNFNDGRLIVIGKDHHSNEPDPNDRRNKDPHPHNALVTVVRSLFEGFGHK